MLGILGSLLPGLLKIGDKLIVDQDKKIEFAFKVQEMTFHLLEQLVTMQTIPWVDAIVKIIVALVALARPLGTFAMTAFGIYAHYKQIVLPTEVHLLLDSAFPAWGAAREVDKGRKHKEKILRNEPDTWSSD